MMGGVMNEHILCKRAMTALWMAFGLLAGLYLTAAMARAEPPMPPPDGPGAMERQPGERGERPDRGDHPPHPLLLVFDTNRDGQLAATEIAAASAVLRALDANADGQISGDELMRALPPPRRDGPPPRDARQHGE